MESIGPKTQMNLGIAEAQAQSLKGNDIKTLLTGEKEVSEKISAGAFAVALLIDKTVLRSKKDTLASMTEKAIGSFKKMKFPKVPEKMKALKLSDLDDARVEMVKTLVSEFGISVEAVKEESKIASQMVSYVNAMLDAYSAMKSGDEGDGKADLQDGMHALECINSEDVHLLSSMPKPPKGVTAIVFALFVITEMHDAKFQNMVENGNTDQMWKVGKCALSDEIVEELKVLDVQKVTQPQRDLARMCLEKYVDSSVQSQSSTAFGLNIFIQALLNNNLPSLEERKKRAMDKVKAMGKIKAAGKLLGKNKAEEEQKKKEEQEKEEQDRIARDLKIKEDAEQKQREKEAAEKREFEKLEKEKEEKKKKKEEEDQKRKQEQAEKKARDEELKKKKEEEKKKKDEEARIKREEEKKQKDEEARIKREEAKKKAEEDERLRQEAIKQKKEADKKRLQEKKEREEAERKKREEKKREPEQFLATSEEASGTVEEEKKMNSISRKGNAKEAKRSITEMQV